jgi:hypothetical protein
MCRLISQARKGAHSSLWQIAVNALSQYWKSESFGRPTLIMNKPGDMQLFAELH